MTRSGDYRRQIPGEEDTVIAEWSAAGFTATTGHPYQLTYVVTLTVHETDTCDWTRLRLR
jgi:hypothetical protein